MNLAQLSTRRHRTWNLKNAQSANSRQLRVLPGVAAVVDACEAMNQGHKGSAGRRIRGEPIHGLAIADCTKSIKYIEEQEGDGIVHKCGKPPISMMVYSTFIFLGRFHEYDPMFCVSATMLESIAVGPGTRL